jgi:CRISPR/Cas system Type II protein with McrA/HNH and RuvC-like nuclease domain
VDAKIQLAGLQDFLSTVYGQGTDLKTLLAGLGFEQAQIALLRDQSLQALVAGFLEAVHQRLTSESGKDTYYQVISRRYGLDGDPPDSTDAIAQKLQLNPGSLRLLLEEAVGRCKTKTAQADFKKSLKHLAIAQLGGMAERPAREHVAGKLERLTNLRAAIDVTRLDYEAKRAAILKQVQAELDALDSEYEPLLESAGENIAALETEIKTEVLLYGESVQAGTYKAVYMQGRVSWDSEGMAKYAASHPDVIRFRKQGQPTVSLRIVDEKP